VASEVEASLAWEEAAGVASRGGRHTSRGGPRRTSVLLCSSQGGAEVGRGEKNAVVGSEVVGPYFMCAFEHKTCLSTGYAAFETWLISCHSS
jgi:hypothetical protein